MLIATLSAELKELFSGLSVTVVVCLLAGLILIVTEFFQPTKNVALICGVAVTALGLGLRIAAYGTPGILFLMVYFCVAVILAAHLVILSANKREWLMLSSGIADEEMSDRNYSFLIGLQGVSTSRIAPFGHMSINDINFYVTADEIIEGGERVIVTAVDREKIFVERVQCEIE